MVFRPMLATDFDEGLLRFPYFASPKLDGIRCMVIDGEARTRSMKLVANRYVRDWFRERANLLADLDGELIVGSPTAPDCFGQTTSAIMSYEGKPAFAFWVFDTVDPTGSLPFTRRWGALLAREPQWPKNVSSVVQHPVHSLDELRKFEETVLGMGFEGAMLRRPDSRYKQGRATLNENSLLKVKRFRDAEAVIVGVEEQMHNTNPAETNEIGRTKRSSAKAGLMGKGTLGALVVQGAPGQPFAGVRFSIGTGLDDAMRKAMWENRTPLIGLQIRYRFFDFGTKDAPRHPIFVGFRKEGT